MGNKELIDKFWPCGYVLLPALCRERLAAGAFVATIKVTVYYRGYAGAWHFLVIFMDNHQ